MKISEKVEMVSRQLKEWRDGYLACLSGEPHESGKSEHYDEGYGDRYQTEQMDGRWSAE